MKDPALYILSAVVALVLQGCTTTEGAFGGGALGALAGQAIGGNTEATLIGAGVGALAGAITADHVNNQRAGSYNRGYSDGYYDAPAAPPPVIERSYYQPAPPPPPYYHRRSIHYRHRPRVIMVPPPPPPPGSVVYYPY